MSNDPKQHFHDRTHQNSWASGVSRRKLFQAGVAFTPLSLIGSSGKDPLLAQAPGGAPLGVVGEPRSDSTIWKSLRQHAAGMSPQAVRDLQNPEIPLEKRWKDLAPYWPFTRTTGYGRCMLIAARDLFGVEDINAQTYRLLSERISAANRFGWYETVLKDRARIESCVLDDLTTQRGEPLKPDPRFFKIVTRFDYIVTADSRDDLTHIEKVTGVAVHTLADLEKALEKAVDKGLREGLAGIKTALAYERTIQFDKVSRADAERCFASLSHPSSSRPQEPAARKPLEDFLLHKVIQQAAEHHLPVQIHTGMQNGNRNHVAWTRPSHLSELLNEYRQVRFDLFHGGYPYGSEFATLAKNLPNVYPDLCWLHIIAPGVAKRSLRELIETVPASKILGFGGDFKHVEGPTPTRKWLAPSPLKYWPRRWRMATSKKRKRRC